MAHNVLTVTNENPTPPTNFSFVGATPPTDPAQVQADDGTAGTLTVFAAKTAVAGTAGYTSVDHEGKGTEVVVLAPGSHVEAPTASFSCLGNYTTTPNASHASYLNSATPATITALAPATPVSGAGVTQLTVTGTGFTRKSEVWISGVRQTTNYVSATSLVVVNAAKKATAGNLPVTVVSDGATTAATNWTFS